ncbi:pentatricopeptide repeat-containing protein At2g33760 [Phoenix dactylifera]|uniref:Pentatricopeptide repeat-containing protein At2g33760 n=1 Tax=Phoenix dactylifera TaxID=42345 RepID=A0A8B7D064_PHODC|nr:pentatricopeptide repeat-containing protein At2g33760 [Phoenix dactylifera]
MEPTPQEPSSSHSPTYQALLRAGPRLRPLHQVHARILVSGLHRSRSLLTKLLTLACTAGAIDYTRRLLYSVPNPDSFLFGSLIRAASKSHLSSDAVFFYHRMLFARLKPSNYTFTSVVKACADLSASKIGRIIHSHVLANGFGLDCFVQTALVVFYAKCGDLGTARQLFDRIPDRSVVAWNAMIAGYEQNGLAEEAIKLFHRMPAEGVEPDSATLVSLLSACSHVCALSLGQWVDKFIVDKGLDVNVVLGTSLINMYARCGHVKKAREVFDGLQERNVVAWTAMISGYGMHGYGNQAVKLFRRMKTEGPSPNDVTFVAVLSACAHAGLVSEGHEVFKSMKQDYGLAPRVEHHVCMVDMFGRAGLLDEAVRFIRDRIPGETGPEVWTAMLGACKMHKDFDLGVEVAKQLLAIEPENPAHYVLLSNLYALAGRMDQVEKIRQVMIHRGLKKNTGYSSIEINRVTHIFRNGDTSHPQTMEIHHYLEELIYRIREAGYVPETDSVLHELEEEEREFALRFHSEKLAVAFGLMSTGNKTLIRIVKNLRICGDCHLAIKFMSVVADREIIVRDKHRFHHFKKGLCSCQDYW